MSTPRIHLETLANEHRIDRDKNKTYTPEEEAEFDRQEREHYASHRERDTAAAAGAGSGAIYASDKHQYAGQNNSTTTSTSSQDTTHHTGRDATLGAGAVGAAGVAEHEHNKHSGRTPLAEKPKGKDIGDTLHGVERNRGVPGPSGIPGTEGFGTGAGGALAADENKGPTPLAEKPKGKDIGDILHGVEGNRGVPGSSGIPGTEGFGTGTGEALAAKEVPQSGRSEATTDQSGAALPLDPNPELGARLTGQHDLSSAGGNNYQTGGKDTTSGSGLTGSQNTDHSSSVPQTAETGGSHVPKSKDE